MEDGACVVEDHTSASVTHPGGGAADEEKVRTPQHAERCKVNRPVTTAVPVVVAKASVDPPTKSRKLASASSASSSNSCALDGIHVSAEGAGGRQEQSRDPKIHSLEVHPSNTLESFYLAPPRENARGIKTLGAHAFCMWQLKFCCALSLLSLHLRSV